MKMKEIEFNLLDEPWIRVLLPDYQVKEVSLTEALLKAHTYVDLAGELPTQDVAVLRLLLAVLLTIFLREDEKGNEAPLEEPDKATDRWEALWDLGAFPEEPIRNYLETWHERFWLFHPERPFWQVPEASMGTEYGAAKLNGEISESSNKLRLFTSYAGQGKTKITYAQATRWLLYINGFDDTSSKPKVKGLPSPGAGWLGKLGLITVQGKNLFETLMLNLTLLKDGKSLWEEPKPCWELEKPRSGERTEIVEPDNYPELLTLQSRRLLLYREDDHVVGYRLLGGDFFNKENAFSEQMTVWKKDAEKNMPDTFSPKRHNASIQFWREFPAIFTGNAVRVPGVVKWIQALKWKKVTHFRIASVAYGDKDFFVTDTFSDSLTFHASLLDELGKNWQKRIQMEIENCHRAAGSLWILAKNLQIAAGGDENNITTNVKDQFYYQIDQPFREWLASIDMDSDQDEMQQAWQDTARKAAYALGWNMVIQTGPAAFSGRILKKKEKGKNAEEKAYHYSAPESFNTFCKQLNRIYKRGDTL